MDNDGGASKFVECIDNSIYIFKNTINTCNGDAVFARKVKYSFYSPIVNRND